MVVQILGVEERSDKTFSLPSCSSPCCPPPCPCLSSSAEAAEFEGNTHRDTLVQGNRLLGQATSRRHSRKLPPSVVYHTT